MNRTVVLVLCLFILGLAALGTSCTNQNQSNLTSTSSPKITETSTSVAASSDNCVICHTNQSTLEKLATKVIVTSTATSGEG